MLSKRDNPRILSAATAVPPHRVEQGDTKEFARRLFDGKFRDLDRLLPIFDNGQIEARYFCQPRGGSGGSGRSPSATPYT